MLHNTQDDRPSQSMPRGHAPAIQQGKITAKWLNINKQFIRFLTGFSVNGTLRKCVVNQPVFVTMWYCNSIIHQLSKTMQYAS